MTILLPITSIPIILNRFVSDCMLKTNRLVTGTSKCCFLNTDPYEVFRKMPSPEPSCYFIKLDLTILHGEAFKIFLDSDTFASLL